MSFSDDKFNFNKGNYKSQCVYMLMLIKQKDAKAWEEFEQEFINVSVEDSYAFYQKLVSFYKDEDSAPEKAAPKKAKPAKKAQKKTAKKTDKKKAKKKTDKKKAKKKTDKKKTAKKATAKKAAKKTTKKKKKSA